MIKHSLRYALVCGVFASMIFYLARALGSNPFIDLNHLFADILLFGVFIFFANKEFKKNINEGILHFWQGMTIGFFTYVGGTVLFLAFLATYFILDPTLLTDYIQDALVYLEERSASYQEEFGDKWSYEDQAQTIKDFQPWDLIKREGIKKLVVGIFVTPVISVILRKQSN